MSEREKEILRNVEAALPKMSDFDKGYMLGIARNYMVKNRKQLIDPITQTPSELAATG